MNNEKEIQLLHDKGFVILRAQRVNNSPIGWKRKITATNKHIKWGYTEEMADPLLSVYHSTFNAAILARSHCGFYLGHGNLCCIDLDTKKTTEAQTTELKNTIAKKFSGSVVVERTKSNGFHIYFLYAERLANNPNWTGLDKGNWIELYYSKRFIACYLSNSKKYSIESGNFLDLKPLSAGAHGKLISILAPYKGKEVRKRKSSAVPVDQATWEQAEAYVKQLEEKELDVTGDNETWFRIGKGFVSAFGAKGYEIFNRLSRFSPLYNADTIESDYNAWLANDNVKGKRVTIATFFKICQDNGLLDIATMQTLRLNPPASVAEFELTITKKQGMAERVHTVVTEFLRHVEICCIDQVSFFIFEQTHWVRRNSRQVIDLLNSFVDRSDVDDRFRIALRTLPYLEMAVRELKLRTMRDAIEPVTGNLRDGIFINLENGVLHIDIKTGRRKLLDHEAKYNFSTLLPYCYDPTAVCPRFDSWLANQIPDKTLHTAYFAFVASCLTKHKADIIMLLVGDTSTGKSSLIEITRRVIGLENSAAVSAGILFGGTAEAQTQAMMMENKLLAYDFDSQPFKHLEMLLKVAAQEPLAGWQMHVARRPVTNYGRLLIAMNRYSYSVFNPAVARRIITIPMDIQFVKDNAVMPAIYENELAGIFNHILNVGVKHLIDNAGQIYVTDAMRQATVDFHMRERDSVRWFNENYTTLKVPIKDNRKVTIQRKFEDANPDFTVSLRKLSDMYNSYRDWLKDEGYSEFKMPLRKYFTTDLKMIGIEESVYFIDGRPERGIYLGTKK